MEIVKRIAEGVVMESAHFVAGILSKNQPAGWRVFEIPDARKSEIRTGIGIRNSCAEAHGVGRVFDVFERRDGGVNVTFATGRWAHWLLDRVVTLDHENPDFVQLDAATKRLINSFQRDVFTIRLLPYLRDGQMVWPAVERGDRLAFRLILTDANGAEGVALDLRPAGEAERAPLQIENTTTEMPAWRL